MSVPVQEHREKKMGSGIRRLLMVLVLLGGGFLAWAIEDRELLNRYYQQILVYIGINIILAVSLSLVNGHLGEFSVGHAGFMAVGAYTASVLTVKIWHVVGPTWLFPLAVCGGGVAAGLGGLLIAFPAFRARGDYLAMVTLAFLMIVKSIIELTPYLGGASMMVGMKRLTTLPWVYAWVVLTILVIRNFVYSRFGRGIMAIRDDELVAALMGVRTRQTKILAFVVSAFFAGAAGGLYAHHLLIITPRGFDILKSTEIIIMLYLGGVGSITGAALGATLYTLILEILTPGNLTDLFAWLPDAAHGWLAGNVFPHFDVWRMIIMPLLLILIMLFRPRGLMGMREPRWFSPPRDRQGGGGGP